MSNRTKIDSSAELLEQYGRHLAELENSRSTIANRKSDLQSLINWSERQNHAQFEIRRFVHSELALYRSWLIANFKPATVNRRLRTLGAFLTWCVSLKVLKQREVPRLELAKPEPPNKFLDKSMSIREQRAFMAAVEAGKRPTDSYIIKIMMSTGLRTSELFSLTWEDVSITETTVTLRLKRSRYKIPVRIPVVSPDARQAFLDLYRACIVSDADAFVLSNRGKQITRRMLERMLNRYSQLARIGMVTPKTVRQTFIRNSITAGMNPHQLAMLIGLQRPEMTAEYYLAGSQDYLRAVQSGSGKTLLDEQ